MHALFGHLIAKMIYISLKLFREEQLGLLLAVIQDIKVLLVSNKSLIGLTYRKEEIR